MATVGTLVFEMNANIARLQQDMAKARSTVETATAGMQSAINVAKGALAGLGIGLSAGAFVGFVDGGIKALAMLRDLSDKTGATVEALSSLKGVAKLAHTDMDEVAASLGKLSKNMLEAADTGGGKAAGAFKALGIQVVDANGKLRNSDEVMQDVAKRLFGMESGTQRVAYAQQLFGKAGAQLLPFLRELAEAGQLSAKVTTEQADAAKRYEDNLIKLQGGANKLKIALANEMLPSLNAITDAMVRAQKEGGILSAILAGLQTAITGTDRYKNDKALTEQTEKLLKLEKNLAETSNLYGANSGRALMIKREIDLTREQIATTLSYRKVLEEEEAAAKPKKKTGGDPALGGGKADGGSVDKAMTEAELLAKNYAKRQAMYEAAEQAADRAAEADKSRSESERANLEKVAATYIDLIDPIEKYRKELLTIDRLEKEGLLNQVQSLEARFAVNEQIDATMKKMQGVQAETKKTNDIGKELGLTMSSAFEDAVIKGKGLMDGLKGIDRDIAQIILRESITKPAGNAISKAVNSSGIGDFLGNLFGGARAGGGSVSAGSAYLVGENGPELVVPGSSGTVVPNNALGGGDTLNITLNVGSLDPRTAANVIMANMGLIQSGIASAFRSAGRATVLG